MKDYNDIVCSTRVRLARNVKGLNFPHKLNGEEAIYSVLFKGVSEACDKLFPNTYYDMGALDPIEAEAMKERHLVSQDLLDRKKYGALILSKTEDISIMLNEEDHIREQSIMNGYKLKDCYRRINTVDDEIASRVPIAFSKKYGYLTTCLTNMGNGMRASVMVFLPAITLTGKIPDLIRTVEKMGLTLRGVYGEGSDAEGYMYQISNQHLQMDSEESILDLLEVTLDKIFVAERKERQQLYMKKKEELKDMMCRSYGLIKYAHMMSSKEFMLNLANVKLGVSLGVINEDMEKLNKLTVYSQPAMLCKMVHKRLGDVDRDKIRMAVARNILNMEEGGEN